MFLSTLRVEHRPSWAEDQVAGKAASQAEPCIFPTGSVSTWSLHSGKSASNSTMSGEPGPRLGSQRECCLELKTLFCKGGGPDILCTETTKEETGPGVLEGTLYKQDKAWLSV